MWTVLFHPEAEQELAALVVVSERAALLHAVTKLEALGPSLPFPHQSAVKGVRALRELRPRGGRSPWRALYRQQGAVFIIAAVGPEAQVNPRDFDRAVRLAGTRLDSITEE
jgi:hypothetical protein